MATEEKSDGPMFAPITSTSRRDSNGLVKIFSKNSQRSSRSHRRRVYDDSDEEQHEFKNERSDWNMMPDVQALQDQNNKDQVKGRKLGVTWNNLTVKGVGADAA